MTTEELEALQSRYTTDADFRRRVDEAGSTKDAIAILREGGYDATAGDLAQLQGGSVEIDLDLIDQLSGGEQYQELNFTFA